MYGADICLQAAERGLAVVVVSALCYHNSRNVGLPKAFFASAETFARKWAHRLPVATACPRSSTCAGKARLLRRTQSSQKTLERELRPESTPMTVPTIQSKADLSRMPGRPGAARKILFASAHSIVDFSNGASVATPDVLQGLTTHGFDCQAPCTPKLDTQRTYFLPLAKVGEGPRPPRASAGSAKGGERRL